jgi:hypothetical protein
VALRLACAAEIRAPPYEPVRGSAVIHPPSRAYESLLMFDKILNSLAASQQRRNALSRWENEGGAIPLSPQVSSTSGEVQSEVPQLTNAELVQLRIRMIALENLVIALLAGAAERQLDLAREMATYISPRPGAHHPLTIHAAAQMIDLVTRAGHFRETTPS